MIYDFLKTFAEGINIPSLIFESFWAVLMFAFLAAFMIIVVLFLVLFERKLLAAFTVRKGPNRVGLNGIFQTIADAIKLLIKEDISAYNTDKILFTLAPLIFFMPVMILFGLMPYTNLLYAVNIPLGVVAVMAVTAFSSLGLILAGWASNNKYSLLGGARAVIQSVSYEIPLVLSILSICVLAGSLNLKEIILAQSGGLFHWYVIPNILGFVIFYISTLAELNRNPFDLPEAENELIGGYNTEYSGMKFAMFFLAEYAQLFILSLLGVLLFCGGFQSPFGIYFGVGFFIQLEQLFWLFAKTFCLIFLAIWIRATLPRIRSDRLSVFCWKYVLPLALLNLLFISIYKFIMGG